MRLPGHTPSFRWLWCSTLCFYTVQGLERIATGWLSLETGGAIGVGGSLAARTLPALLLGLPAGTAADRSSRVGQLALVAGLCIPLMLAVSAMSALGLLGSVAIVVYSFLFGCITVFDPPARQALILDTVPVEAAPSALAVNAFGSRLAMAFGAAAGGWLIAVYGAALCFLVVSGFFVLSLVFLALVRVAPAERDRTRPPFGRALLDAARLLLDVPAIRLLSIVGIAGEVFAFSNSTALPVLARDVLESGATGLGSLQSASASGAMVAVFLLALLPGRIRREPVLTVVFLIFGVALIALSRVSSVPAGMVVMVVVGACAALFDTLQQTLLQLAVPADQRGRAGGIWMVGIGSAPAGHLEMGFLVAMLGAPVALVINGGIVVAAAMTLMVLAKAYALTSFRRAS